MSDAKKCDRCKKFYLETDDLKTRPAYAELKIFSVELKSINCSHIRGYDLCAACALKLDLFLNGSDAE